MIDARTILAARAAALARPAPSVPSGASLEVLEFGLASERYAVELAHIQGVHPLRSLMPVPCTPAYVLGVISVRGTLCAVVDLREVFGLPVQGLANSTSAVILGDAAVELGVLADTVTGVCALAASSLAALALEDPRVGFVRGIAADGLVVLDAPALLAHPSMRIGDSFGI